MLVKTLQVPEMPKLTLVLLLLIDIVTSVAASSETVYSYRKSDGSAAFSDRRPLNNHYRVLKFDCFACLVTSNINWHKTPLYRDKYHANIIAASQTHQIEPALIKAIIHAESSFRPEVISKVGAIGLMQLMPATAQELGVKKPLQVQQNIDGGTRYLAWLLQKFHGNIELASAAYNAGPSTVKKYNGVPPYPETQAYVERVKILHRRYGML